MRHPVGARRWPSTRKAHLVETEGLEQPNPFGVLVWPEHEEMQLAFGACSSAAEAGSTGPAGSTGQAGSTGPDGVTDVAVKEHFGSETEVVAAGKGGRYEIVAEYRPLLLEFLQRHSRSFVQLEFAQVSDPQQQSQSRSQGQSQSQSGGCAPSSGCGEHKAEASAAVGGLMPTVRALDATGAKVECFLPLRVHIPGW